MLCSGDDSQAFKKLKRKKKVGTNVSTEGPMSRQAQQLLNFANVSTVCHRVTPPHPRPLATALVLGDWSYHILLYSILHVLIASPSCSIVIEFIW